ncbi:glutathione peroxidase [Parashewanella tropica]|uniref:glutathione peroxidase n=1 Tax=Parashewanella tropica TaxID=2547970 RepID=UPI001059E86E|nr:glutathione peroxidase [Parashewanella tropica]
MKPSIYQFSALDITGKEVALSDYSEQVVLIVNTASKCGFTPQYKGLEALYNSYKEQGFTVLGFPCNQFGQQEKGSESEIAEFCELNFGVTFPLFSKIDVNGDNTHPLYQFLKKEAKGVLGTQKIKWNFTKFLVNKKGQVVQRYSPTTKPEQIENDIKKLLS